MRNTARLMTIVVALSASSAFAADWPWIYGPKGNSTSDQKGLLRTWPEAGPKVLWTAPMGAGFGGPAVSDGKVYLLDRDEEVGDKLRVFDLASGKELWTFAYDAPGQVHVCRLADHPDGRRRTRLHLRTAGRPVRHRHQDAPTGLAQEHLEGLRRRRAAPVGHHPEPADLRQAGHRGAADVPGGCGRLRQADG